MKIVITGASSGIGKALVEHFSKTGNEVYCCARRIEKLRAATAALAGVHPFQCDVGVETDVAAFARFVSSKTDAIDVLVNCASAFGAIGPTLETDTSQFIKTLNDNLIGTYLVSKHFLSLLKTSSQASIVNFAGGGAFSPFPRYSGYAISKAGVVRLTENLAIELAEFGVRVNAVAPGFVATEIHEATLNAGEAQAGENHFAMTQSSMTQGAVPIEVPVACVDFLASPESAPLTGKTISASFDPWRTDEFQAVISQVNDSELYTLRRMNLVNLGLSDIKQVGNRTVG